MSFLQRWRGIVGEAIGAITARPGRAVLSSLATILGVGTLISTLAITGTARAAINARFDALAATQITVQDAKPGGPHPFPVDTEARLTRLDGVTAAGLIWDVDTNNTAVAALPVSKAPRAQQQPKMLAVTPGTFRVLHPRMMAGRLFDAFHEKQAVRVAVLGATAARQLGIGSIDGIRSVAIGGVQFAVIGIIDRTERNQEALLSVMIPTATATRYFGSPRTGASAIIETRLGAAGVIASEVRPALLPSDMNRLVVTAPPDPRSLRDKVNTDVSGLFVILGVVSLAIGTVGIGNSALVATVERTFEIGLRRAVGARRGEIAVQFLIETAMIGTAGGIVGTTLALLLTVALAAIRHWTPVLSLEAIVVAPALGTLAGILAGAYPAWRAARLDPVTALTH